MTTYTYEKLASEYQSLWNSMKIIRDAAELDRLATKIKTNQAVYQKVQDATGVPWQMVAVIHIREAGETDIGQWKRVLHNGERIIGTGRKTKIVPTGQGPFTTWHEAAVHALTMKGFNKIKAWPVSRILWGLEPYNGYGYRNMGLRSPYLWASTNHQQPGKYVRDHVFDANVVDKQIGAAALLKYLGVGNTTPKKIAEPAAATAAVSGTLAAIYQWGLDHPFEVAVGVIAISGLTWFIVKRYRQYKESKLNVG